MSELGQIKAHLVAESSEWVQGLEKGAQAIDRFEKKQAAALKRIEREQKAAAKAAADAAQKSATELKSFGDGVTQMAAKITAFAGDVARSAAAADDLTDSLAAAFGDRADRMSGTIQKLGTGLGVFSDQQVRGAAVNLEKLGVASEQNLQRVVDAAAKTGKSVEGLGESFGRFEKFGDSKSTLALQKALGITGQEMAAAGAKIDATNKVLADTPARAEAARVAMQAIIDTRFAGAAAAMADDSQRLTGELELLKREVGASAHAFKESLAPAGLAVVGMLRDLSPEAKGAAGLVLEIGSSAVGAGAQALTGAANLALLTQSTTACSIASKGAAFAAGLMGNAFAVSLGAVGLLAAGLMAYTAYLEHANAAAEKLLQTEEKRARTTAGLKEKGNVDKSGHTVSTKGATVEQLEANVAEMRDRYKKVAGDGRTVSQRKHDEGGGASSVDDFSTINDGDAKARNAARVRVVEAEAALAKKKAEIAAGEKAKPAGDIDAPSAKEQAKLDKIQARKDAAAEKLRKKELSSEIATVTQGLAARKITAEQAIRSLEDIKSAHAKNAEERLAIDGKIATLTGQLEAKKTADAKKEEAKRLAEVKKVQHEQEAAEKKAEAERKKLHAEALKDQRKATQDAQKAAKADAVQHAKETAKDAAAAAKQGAATDLAPAPFGATLPQFGGGPIAGTLDERQAADAEAQRKKRDIGMASNEAEAGRIAARGGPGRGAVGKYAYDSSATTTGAHIMAGVGRRLRARRAVDLIEASRGAAPVAASAGAAALTWAEKMARRATRDQLTTIPAGEHAIADEDAMAAGFGKSGLTLKSATPGRLASMKGAADTGMIGGIGFGPQVASAVKSALESTPLQIVFQMNGKTVGTFTGSAAELARQKNVVNPNVSLGGAG